VHIVYTKQELQCLFYTVKKITLKTGDCHLCLILPHMINRQISQDSFLLISVIGGSMAYVSISSIRSIERTRITPDTRFTVNKIIEIYKRINDALMKSNMYENVYNLEIQYRLADTYRERLKELTLEEVISR
jgi:hypothetical protein